MQRKINLLKNQTPILRNTNKEQFSSAVVLQEVSFTDHRHSIIGINLLLRNFKFPKHSNNINIKQRHKAVKNENTTFVRPPNVDIV